VEFGLAFFATDTTLDPVTLARAAEDRGFESLWLSEHSHIPSSRRTPRGGVEGAGPLPDHYSRTYDTMVALGAAAATTTRIKLATGISLVAQRDPIWTAKEVATIDRLSNGRFIFGIGYGWNREEMASHGLSYRDRRDVLRENVLAMKRLWTDDEATFEGEHVTFEPSWAWPKPLQQPHPPIVLGAAAGPRTIDHLVEFCDGWIPLERYELEHSIASVRRALQAAGRSVEQFELSYFGAQADPAEVERLRDLGFTRVLLSLPSSPPAQAMDELDALTEFVQEVR
jgi:probable F420-dependent oxidoreductase